MLNSEVFSERMYNASVHTHAHKTLRSKGTAFMRLVFGCAQKEAPVVIGRPLSRPTSRSSTLAAFGIKVLNSKRWASQETA